MDAKRILRSAIDVLRGEERGVGLDRLELEMLPDSLSKEILVMMGLEYESERRREEPLLILLALRP